METRQNIPTKELRSKEDELLILQQKAINLLQQKKPSISPELIKYYGYENSLLQTLMNGKPKFDRTGTDTIGIHGHQSRFNLDHGFPLLTTKKVHLKSVIHELLWLIRGETNIKYLVENGVSIWSDWPLKHYNQSRRNDTQFHASMSGTIIAEYETESIQDISLDEFHQKILHEQGFAERWGDLGPVYGKQWRAWEHWTVYQGDIKKQNPHLNIQIFEDSAHMRPIDQIQATIDAINRQHETGVISRRMLVSAWNVSDLPAMVKSGLPPCHCLFQFHSRLMTLKERLIYWAQKNEKSLAYVEKMTDDDLDRVGAPVYELDLQLYQRSCDSFLGVPFNVASYALLLMMVAQVTNCKPGTFIHDYGDFHIYKNHLDQVVEQLSREPRPYPTMKLVNRGQKIDEFQFDDFILEGYNPHPQIKAPVAV